MIYQNFKIGINLFYTINLKYIPIYNLRVGNSSFRRCHFGQNLFLSITRLCIGMSTFTDQNKLLKRIRKCCLQKRPEIKPRTQNKQSTDRSLFSNEKCNIAKTIACKCRGQISLQYISCQELNIDASYVMKSIFHLVHQIPLKLN